MKKLFFIFLTVVFFVSSIMFFVVNPVVNAMSMPNEIRLTNEEYRDENILPSGRFVTQHNNYSASVSDNDEKYIDLKLFGIFKIKRVKVDVMPVEQLAVGGVTIGFIAKSNGVVVVGNAPNYGLKKGDIIKKINGTEIVSIEDFNNYLGMATGRTEFNVEVQRGSDLVTTKFEVNMDLKRHLGLWLKDETTGVGALTYINPKNNNFAALGHRMKDHETGANIDVRGGDVYKTNIIGIEKSNGHKVGEFKSTLQQGLEGKQGEMLSSNSGGVFGCLFADSALLQEAVTIYPVGSRYSVRPGAAKLRTSLDGTTVKEYDIEIVKTYYQKKRGTKSMIIRITDKELIAKSGGIIHGMSGSPIIQKGKIVGALTHVIVNDTTKGYGIYIDFVIP